MRRIIINSTVLALFISMISVPPVFAAYIDPNTGGMLFQLLAVLLAIFSGALLFFSARIRMAFARAKRWLLARLKRWGLVKEADSST